MVAMQRAILKSIKVLAYLSLDLTSHLRWQSKNDFHENVPLIIKFSSTHFMLQDIVGGAGTVSWDLWGPDSRAISSTSAELFYT
jgi:hypothetical protein